MEVDKIQDMRVSLITVSYNSQAHIRSTIESVLSQTYPDIEYIIVDGSSKDNTVEIIKSYEDKFDDWLKWVSEPDKGMYDAMNKGIRMATGDIVGILNSDDFFSGNTVVENIVKVFQTGNVDALYGDVKFVSPENLKKITRYYSSKIFTPKLFRFGFMPAHPSFYTYKRNFNKYGYYKTDYKIAADYELLIRFLYTNKLKAKYLNKSFVTMRTGGESTRNWKSNVVLNKEIVRGCKENGIYTNMFVLSFKYIVKVWELILTKK